MKGFKLAVARLTSIDLSMVSGTAIGYCSMDVKGLFGTDMFWKGFFQSTDLNILGIKSAF